MVIGIDVDDTITKTSEYANKLLKNDSDFNYVLDYHDLKKSDYNNFINKYIGNIYDFVPPKEDVVEVLNKWHDEGKKIIFITARGRDNYKDALSKTGLYFAKNHIYYDEIVFKQKSKFSACIKYKVDLFIDDKEEVLDEIKEHNIDTLRIANIKESKHEIANNWQEIKDYVDRWVSYGRKNNWCKYKYRRYIW